MKMPKLLKQANIILYDGSTFDDEGEPKNGFYFQILNADGSPDGDETGPYSSGPECELACQQEYDLS